MPRSYLRTVYIMDRHDILKDRKKDGYWMDDRYGAWFSHVGFAQIISNKTLKPLKSTATDAYPVNPILLNRFVAH